MKTLKHLIRFTLSAGGYFLLTLIINAPVAFAFWPVPLLFGLCYVLYRDLNDRFKDALR